MEQVLRGLQKILICIDNVLIHTNTHEKHLEALEQVLMRLHQHHLKINLDKCLFGDKTKGVIIPNFHARGRANASRSQARDATKI
jgi:hypothetical protein